MSQHQYQRQKTLSHAAGLIHFNDNTQNQEKSAFLPSASVVSLYRQAKKPLLLFALVVSLGVQFYRPAPSITFVEAPVVTSVRELPGMTIHYVIESPAKKVISTQQEHLTEQAKSTKKKLELEIEAMKEKKLIYQHQQEAIEYARNFPKDTALEIAVLKDKLDRLPYQSQ